MDIQILEPADISDWKGEKVGLLDRSIRVMDKDVILSSTDYENLLLTFKDGLNSVFLESERIDTIISMIKEDIHYQTGIDFPEPIGGKYISQICTSFGIDCIISIELSSYRIVRNELKGDWFIRLYSSESIALDSIHYSGSALTIEDKAWECGVEYAQRLVPHWAPAVRRVYNKGKVLTMGDAFFRDGNIHEALQVWTAGLKLSPRIAVKSAVNIAWLYESTDDFESALYMLQNVRQMIEEKKIKNKAASYAANYLPMIQKRIENRERLKQQQEPVSEN